MTEHVYKGEPVTTAIHPLKQRIAELKAERDKYHRTCLEYVDSLARREAELALKDKMLQVLAEQVVKYGYNANIWPNIHLLRSEYIIEVIAEAEAKAKED